MMEVIKRRHAKTAGLLHYFTGKPCRQGHIAMRYVSSKTCSACLKASCKVYSQTNVKRLSAKSLEAYHRNPKKKMESVKRWQAANPENVRKSKKKWQDANLEVKRVHTRARRARKRAAEGNHTISDVREIAKLQRNKCAYCRRSLSGARREVDHIRALSRGGSNNRRNLQILCRTCNTRKGAKDPMQFAREQGLLL
jgi:5-methylcytosine-specific restriction endonuclease McrA